VVIEGEANSVSCTSSSFCTAVSFDSFFETYNGSSWSERRTVGFDQLESLSCASASFRVVGAIGGYALTFNGATWGAPVKIDSANGFIHALSCPSSSFCAAVDGGGNAVTFNGSAWGQPVLLDGNDGSGLASVSCRSSSFCAAVGGGDAVIASVPKVTKVTPSKGPVGGGTSVTITGTSFTGATTVSFGSVSATGFKVSSSTSITAVAPAEVAGSVDVRVTTQAGTSAVSSADRFSFSPTVSKPVPNEGPSSGGTSLTITGTGFVQGGTTIKFGSAVATSVKCTSWKVTTPKVETTCTVVAPAHQAGKVDVTATVNKVSSPKTPADRFTYA
jgi:hypothetical protein